MCVFVCEWPATEQKFQGRPSLSSSGLKKPQVEANRQASMRSLGQS